MKAVLAALLVSLCAALACPARADDLVLSGTLKTIHDRGTILIGVRTDAVPFAFRNPGGQPIGFSVDICHGIASDVAGLLHSDLLEPDSPTWATGLRIVYVPVAADARLPMIVSGAVDLECGSTTATAERAKTIAFSPVFFLAGTKILVATTSAINTFRDLHTVSAASGTTNADVMKNLAGEATPPFRVELTPDIPAAYGMLESGAVDAVASDDILLAGLVATRGDAQRFRLAGDYLSFEPYAIGYRRDDPDFAALIKQSFGRMAQEGTLATRYRRWFNDALPNGQRLNLPMSAQLTAMYRVLGQPD